MHLQLDTSWSRMQSCWSYKCYWFWFVLKKMFICNYYKMDYKLCSLISVQCLLSYVALILKQWFGSGVFSQAWWTEFLLPVMLAGMVPVSTVYKYIHFCIFYVIIRFSFRVWIKIVISGHANQTASIQLIKNPLDSHRSKLRHNILAIMTCAKAYL